MNARTTGVVADGGRARILVEGRPGGPLTGKTPRLELPDHHEQAHSEAYQGSDRFGQASQGVAGEARHDCLDATAATLRIAPREFRREGA